MNRLQHILDELVNNEKTGHAGFHNYSPATMRALMQRLGQPHRGFKSVHIAGTNGKGSTAYMISRILMTAGYKTGLYVSPHLNTVTERISINGHPIKEKNLVTILNYVLEQSHIGLLRPTWFDALTAAAFHYFEMESVDIAVVETGLGGRLDSTNVLRPLVSIITTIALDHIPLLGKTLREISAEKAGIIKNGVPVIAGNITGDPLAAIESTCREKRSSLYVIGKDFSIDAFPQSEQDTFSYTFGTRRIENLRLGPRGGFQRTNAALAITATLLLGRRGFAVAPRDIRIALKRLVIPGRLEIISEKPLIIFDPAHNPEALRTILNHISAEYPDRKPVFVVCFMKDKDVEGLFEVLYAADPTAIVYYLLEDERAFNPGTSPPDTEGMPFYLISGTDGGKRLSDIITHLAGDDRIIVATGSFRIYTAVKKLALNFRE